MKLTIEDYRDPKEPCVNCKFYAKEMKQHEAPFYKRIMNIEVFETGQKLCLEHKQFVYFNQSCPSYNPS
ncbi:MAG TPA: hypothetical protein DCX92_11990 [Bacteroidetes bacterium]|nr:hypothetical protein [Bacteroidota bacterium]